MLFSANFTGIELATADLIGVGIRMGTLLGALIFGVSNISFKEQLLLILLLIYCIRICYSEASGLFALMMPFTLRCFGIDY